MSKLIVNNGGYRTTISIPKRLTEDVLCTFTVENILKRKEEYTLDSDYFMFTIKVSDDDVIFDSLLLFDNHFTDHQPDFIYSMDHFDVNSNSEDTMLLLISCDVRKRYELKWVISRAVLLLLDFLESKKSLVY